MTSDPFPPDHAADPLEGVAAISAVTSEMMDEAAHKVAETADAVAHRPEAPEALRETDHDAAHADIEPLAEATVGSGPATAAEVGRAAEDAARDAAEAGEAMSASAGDAVERTGEAARRTVAGSADALAQYNGKVLEIIQANLAATGAFFTALMGVTSVPEAMALNADHLRRQMDAMTTQGRELASLAQKLAFDAMQPMADTVASRFRDR